jgi:NAD(P)-dependent dehydrogenase (short-subunit alcohol dehydrogenase family)
MSDTQPGPARRLIGKRALVTGGGSGIGRGAALRLAAEGARVAVLGITLDTVVQAVDEIEMLGGEALAIEADVGDEQAVTDAFERCRSEWQGLDILVSNAGVELAEDAAVHELELSAWERTIRTNLTGTFLVCKYGVRLLMASGGGSVVIVGSPCGMYGLELGFHAYSASKGGVHGLARVMANEYAQQGIRVNVVVPGLVRTPINDAFYENESLVEATMRSIPLRREGRVDEIAAAIAFLASDEASYAVGSLFVVDGGLTAI